MEWIAGIQRAIDYIEEHLDGEIDLSEVGKQAYLSPFYFQRIFRFLCDMTVGEYIRLRRLTLAGAELAAGNGKVIDVALKYGYDSPESFARAFSKFHGVPPSAAKKKSASLKSFSRLSVKLSLTGGSTMNYQIVTRQAFQVVGKQFYTDIDDNVNRNSIPDFWTECHRDGTVKTLSALSEDERILGLCYSNMAKDAKTFVYSIAAKYDGKAPVPEGFSLWEVPAHTWIAFQAKGAMPGGIQETWHTIYTEFFPASPYRPVCDVDIEVYPAGDMDSPSYESEIWVAVEKE